MSTDASTGAAASSAEVGSSGSASSAASTGSPASTGGVNWGDDWRQRIAQGTTDPEKELTRLQRFEAPDGIYRSFRELEGKQSRGELKSVLPKGATAEEKARWRQENGIPGKAEEYKITMPAGRDVPKEDDPFLKSFLKSAHEADYTQPQVDQAITAFYAEVDRQTNALTEAEKNAIDDTDGKLRQEWGGDYRTNKNMAEALLARAPAGFRDRFMNGYLADHTPIQASPEAWKWLVQMEREINPAATVVPGVGGDPGKTVADELSSLKTLMGDRNSAYWKGPDAEKNQARYRQLIEVQEKLKAKQGATA